MKRWMLLMPVLGLAGGLLAGCGLFGGEEEEKKPEAPTLTLVGRVASKPSGTDFVLIESYGDWRVPTGGILLTQGPGGRTGNLFVTGEKLGQFAAADIRGGTVEPGDAAYYRPLVEPTEAQTAGGEGAGAGAGTGEKKPEEATPAKEGDKARNKGQGTENPPKKPGA